jgi:streptogramin lyase
MFRQLGIKITVITLGIFLAGCGGGGGGSPSAATNNTSAATGTTGGTSNGGASNGGATTGNGSTTTAPTFVYDETARFNGPRGVRTDAAGNVYVLDGERGLIRKIAPTGAVSSLPQLQGRAGQFRELEVDAAGNVYVTTGFNGEIFKLTPAGTVSVIATILNAKDPAVDAQGNVYVTAPGPMYFTPSSTDYGTLIYRITPAGEVSTVFTGADARYFGLTVDAAGNLYTVRAVSQQAFEGTIVKISPTGVMTDLAPFSFRIYPDEQHKPTRIANLSLDASGNLYVAHYREQLPSSGGCASNPANCKPPYESGMAIDKITPAGVTTRVRTGPPGSTGTLAEDLYDRDYGMSYIDVGSDGNIYASYRQNHAVYRISQSGETTLFAGKPGEAGSTD